MLPQRAALRRGRGAGGKAGAGPKTAAWEKAFNLMSACIFHRRVLVNGHLISLSIFKRSGMYLKAKGLGSKEKPELDSKTLRNYFQESHVDKGVGFWLLFLALALHHLGQVFSAVGISPLLPLFA